MLLLDNGIVGAVVATAVVDLTNAVVPGSHGVAIVVGGGHEFDIVVVSETQRVFFSDQK